MTEFCVIHIEDDAEQVNSAAVLASPIRTIVKSTKASADGVGVTSTKDVSLPGTPDPPSPTPSATERDNSDTSTSDPQASWCSSSISSEISIKSTEALIAKTNN